MMRVLASLMILGLAACSGQATDAGSAVAEVDQGARCGGARAGVAWLERDRGVLRVSLGERPSAGYRLRLAEPAMESTESGLVINVVEIQPAADAVVAQVLTRPCLDLRIDPPPQRAVIVRAVNGDRLGVLED